MKNSSSNIFGKLKFIFISVLLFVMMFANAQVSRRSYLNNTPHRGNFQRMSAGLKFTLEIRNGKLWSWGSNAYGQLGDGTTDSTDSPKQIGTDSSWVTIAAGDYHSLGIKADGSLWAWGLNSSGQLGDGSFLNKIVPQQIGSDNSWICVSAGGKHSLALKADGSLWAWGDNTSGQLGNGSNVNENLPQRIGLDNNWILIEASTSSSFALKTNGRLWSWGLGVNGNLGYFSFGQNTPVEITSDSNWVSVSASYSHTLGLKSDGSLWAWGNNGDGQLGNGSSASPISPIKIGNDNNWICIQANGDYSGHSIALKSNGTLWGWGDNGLGQLGLGNQISRNIPTQIGTDNKWVSINAGGYHTLASKSDGTLWAWGYNFSGQIGNNTSFTIEKTPLSITTQNKWLMTAAYGDQSFGLRTNGTLWSWGQNNYGQLGIGTTVNRISPLQIGISNKWVSVASGGYHTLGIMSDGTLWAWGLNSNGQLGNGTNTDTLSPKQVGIEHNWVSISAGENHSLALKSDGTLWAWGANNYGQLGDNSQTDRLIPVKIGTDSNWVSIKAGEFHSLGLKSNGTIWAWGSGGQGQLGNGMTGVTSLYPIQIGSANSWVNIAAGSGFTLALKSEGTIWACGSNNVGQLGDSTVPNLQANLVQIGTANNWLNISSGYLNVLASQANGTLWGWGFNPYGQLGTGTTVNVKNVKRITSIQNCIASSPGYRHSLILKADRNLFCASGLNVNGQLGNCTSTNAINFVCSNSPNAIVINTQPTNKSVCLGGTTSFNVSANNSAQYQWRANGVNLSNSGGYSGVTTATLTITGATMGMTGKKYTCLLGSNCTLFASSDTVMLTINPLPNLTVTAYPDSCKSNGAASAIVTSGTPPYTYTWSTGASTSLITGLLPNTYSITINDSKNCSAAGSAIVGNTVAAPVPICLATVDSLSKHNVIVWEKPVTTFIDSFRIYREDLTNVYSYVASVDYNQLSQYTDTAASVDPILNSRRYRMAIVDNCGQVSALSKWHNTILLQDQQNGNFNWNFYEVENQTSSLVNQYILQRYDSTSSSWIPINNTPGTQNSMVAPNYFTHQYSLYRVLSDLGSYGCTPTARVATGINNTRSNIKNKIAPNSIPENSVFENQIILLPNPAKDLVKIKSSLALESILLMDNLGRIVLQKNMESDYSKEVNLSITTLKSGLYYVVCKGKNFEMRKKLLVN
ncbi:MAG: T9SS type A sorting domain-containing protein [Bacteroidetes bacterium]|nr:T9SS type A sorting domain-containing protein [Bacteroidota bacterium]